MKQIAIALAVLAVAFQADAGNGANQVPSCYAANGMAVRPPAREVTVLIDQTTLLDEELKRSVMQNMDGLLAPGTSFSVIRYSAYAQGRYTSVVARGVLEAPLAEKERNAIGVKVLKSFDVCMKGQLDYGRRLAAEAISKAMSEASGDLAKSDVASALREASAVTRQAPARDRIVLVVSDMLENSSVTSFYAKNAVRPIDPAAELVKIAKAGLLADFGGARVFVIGAGLIAADTKGRENVYRDPKTVRLLAEFWSGYFGKSNARLTEFGQPALLNPVR